MREYYHRHSKNCDELRKGEREMEIKAFAATLGLGMLAGAAVVMMLPKDSAAYQAVDDAAQSVKNGVSNAVQSVMDG